jgi:hypothetical protein
MEVNIVYIDDVSQELRKYEAKFKTDPRAMGKFTIKTFNSPKSRADYDHINGVAPELLLVDFNLDIPDENGKVIGISGVTLSTELRQKFREVPIILFTRKSVFNLQDYTKIRETLSSIDEIIYKQEVFKPDSTILDDLYKLATGYRILRNQTNRSWNDLLKLLGASQSDSELLEQSNPPVVRRQRWAAASVASWIRDIVIRFPGILYDGLHAATFLGVSKEVFLSENIQNAFAPAKYTGIFEPPEGRWWKSKLQAVAYSMMNKKERELLLRHGFPAAWERSKGTSIDRAKCVFSGESSADWVCHILKEPVMIKYSLSYGADDRPAVMDEARVSYEAIRTSNDFDEKLVDPLGKELIADIRRMPKPGG